MKLASLFNWFREKKSPVAKVFTEIYQQNIWDCSETRSGPGSSLARTEVIRRELPALLAELQITSLLDAPCGDLNWLAGIALPVRRYVGVDVVAPLIAENRRWFGTRARKFLVADFIRATLPRHAAILCRDGLIHLPNAEVLLSLKNFQRSGATFLLATTHSLIEENVDIPTGAWRSVNLQLPPFSLPPPLRHIVENPTTGKLLGVWRLAELKFP